MTNQNKKQNTIIKKYERRWVKPTVITLIIILIPLFFFGLKHGSTVVKAISDYDASINETMTLIGRKDKEMFFENTPKQGVHPIVSSEKELPEKPVLIAFYLLHCPYCEMAKPSIEKERLRLIDQYDSIDDQFIYVNVQSSLGKQLIHKYNVTGASSMLLLAPDEKDNKLIASGKVGPIGQPQPNDQEIQSIVTAFENIIK